MVRNYLILCLFGIWSFCIVNSVGHVAIINGDQTSVDQFPYQVGIHFLHRRPKCGGGIINQNFVVTAAHCLYTREGHIDRSPLFVFAGSNDLLRNTEYAVDIPIRKVFVPREYRFAVNTNGDIAVLMLNNPLVISAHIKNLKLPEDKNETYIGKTAMIAGWGWDWRMVQNGTETGGTSDTFLRYSVTHVREYCFQNHVRLDVPKNKLCAQIDQRDISRPLGVCVGDSGSPLVHSHTLIGVLSIGPFDCSEVNTGAIYTRVTSYLSFIHRAMQNRHYDDIRAVELRI